jgi:universal stress protein A
VIPEKIVVCTDFSENSVKARVCAVEYAKVFQAELIILHVVNSRLVGYPDFASKYPDEVASVEQNIERGAEEELELLANDCSRTIERVRTCCLSGAPAEEIVRFAEQESAGLIVVGTHGWTGARRIILGSIAENVVRTAKCPVLTVRSEAK